ncbi:MAG: hypothetical protein H7333_00520 [Bdellovibrionales bacterium]|nr:hypothetical protein [Oligoflexia bacterium]
MPFSKNPLKFILCAVLGFYSVQPTFADILSSAFNLQLSVQSATTLLGGASQLSLPAGSFRTDLPNQNYTTPYAVAISGIHLALDYTFKTPTAGSSLNEWNIETSNVGADLAVDLINASQTITQSSGGSTIDIRVDAVCKDVRLRLAPGATQIQASVGVTFENGRATYTLKNFLANWSPTAWQIVSLNCEGPEGFGDTVRAELTRQLESINPFLPQIESQIQSQLTAASHQALSWTLQAPDASGISVTLAPRNLQVLNDGAVRVEGLATFNFSKLKNSNCQKEITSPAAEPGASDSLMLPLAAIEGLLDCAYLNNEPVLSFTNKEVRVFQRLLGNRLYKLLVWPHLLKFNQSSDFTFHLRLNDAPAFGPLSASPSGDFTFPLHSHLKLGIDFPTPTGPMHAIDFSTQLEGPAQLSIRDGVVSFHQDSKALTLSRFWDEAYLQRFNPKQRINTSVIARYLGPFLLNSGITYALPGFEAPGAFTLAVDRATAMGENASISLKIKPLSTR